MRFGEVWYNGEMERYKEYLNAKISKIGVGDDLRAKIIKIAEKLRKF